MFEYFILKNPFADMRKGPPMPGKTKTTKPKNIVQYIPASEYAAFCARYKPNCGVNQRQDKRDKNKAWRKFKPPYRIKTHDHNSSSFKVWSSFQLFWSSMKNQKKRTVKEY